MEARPLARSMPPTEASKTRLRKHADYQRVYKQGRKQTSQQMSYFYARRAAEPGGADITPTPRVGLTAGKVLGNAVLRNRIKRRMREAIRKHIALLSGPVDVILHPRKTVLEIEFSKLEREVARIFANVQSSLERPSATRAVPDPRVDVPRAPDPRAPAPQAPRSRTPRNESQPNASQPRPKP